ncbi:N-acetyltransferase family protein [Stella sp.]|uniref:GNAT family N-acetyltransferase n=1 Tax=Stella sp. TaxID=2912054 RepID=UPI0035B0781E
MERPGPGHPGPAPHPEPAGPAGADALALRPATPADAAMIAAIHVRSWRAVYRGILPDAYLDDAADAERLDHWSRMLDRPDPSLLVLLLTGADGVLGFVAGRMPADDGYDSYIDNLHVDPARRGGGLGRRLLGAAAEAFLARGARNLFLWLFDGNAPAGRFYARLGGVVAEHDFDDFAGARIPHTRIVFPDLAALAAACRSGTGTPAAPGG